MRKKRYIGDREVLKITGDTAHFAPVPGKPDSEEFSKELLSNIVTDAPLDASSLRERRCFPAVKEILGVLLRHNLYLGEIDFTLSRVVMSVNQNRETAEDKLWGSEEGKKTVRQLDSLLKG